MICAQCCDAPRRPIEIWLLISARLRRSASRRALAVEDFCHGAFGLPRLPMSAARVSPTRQGAASPWSARRAALRHRLAYANSIIASDRLVSFPAL